MVLTREVVSICSLWTLSTANTANLASNANFTKWICSLCPEREKFSSRCDKPFGVRKRIIMSERKSASEYLTIIDFQNLDKYRNFAFEPQVLQIGDNVLESLIGEKF